jgi:tetratricopeptide (TPR) repeat protein
MRKCVLVWLAASVLSASTALAVDAVYLVDGQMLGKVKQVSRLEVLLERPGGEGEIEKIPVNRVRWIKFESESPQLGLARAAIYTNGNFDEGLRVLAKVAPADLKDELQKQDHEFLSAYSTARKAASTGEPAADAIAALKTYLGRYPESYHTFQAVEALGDLLSADGQWDAAVAEYLKLEESGFADLKLRGAIGRARGLQKQKKFDDAISAFDAALAQAGNPPAEDLIGVVQSATLGKASCLTESNRADQAVAMIEAVIMEAKPEDHELHARAYVAHGNALRKAGRDGEALLAFLHVDVLYSTFPEQHSEALYNLVDLWKVVMKLQESRQALDLLIERYPNSQWAKPASG